MTKIDERKERTMTEGTTMQAPAALSLPPRLHPDDVVQYVRLLDGVPQPVPVMKETGEGWRRTDEQAVDDRGVPMWEYAGLLATPRYGRCDWDAATIRVASAAATPLTPFGPLEAADVRVERRRSKAGVERVTIHVGALGRVDAQAKGRG